MSGELDWNAIPVLCEMYGVEDADVLIVQLLAIRDHVRRKADAR